MAPSVTAFGRSPLINESPDGTCCVRAESSKSSPRKADEAARRQGRGRSAVRRKGRY